ncbi:RNA polymerase sigma factor [Miltoncostaea marina]|uniref:RNA polymerase sigma factor n=1 Tax=Miltoncostaea marina TaxID=2843215 RepID=UPI001C3C9281|nr:sigma-70 family RNA polymerase sigma factor [Miltoncostaea marina]
MAVEPGSPRVEAAPAGLRDDLLARALARGDGEAFAGICARARPTITRMGARLVGRDAAEDLAQDVLARVWERRGQFDPGRGRLMSWIWGIARNAATDRLRERSGEAQAHGRLRAVAQLADPEVPEERLLAREAADGVRRALAALDREQRAAIWRSFWLDQSHAEIARCTGEPLGTVKGRIRRGISRMARDMPAGRG